MSYNDVKKIFDAADDKNGVSIETRLLFEIFGCLDSIAHSYREMLKIQQAREKTDAARRKESSWAEREDSRLAALRTKKGTK